MAVFYCIIALLLTYRPKILHGNIVFFDSSFPFDAPGFLPVRGRQREGAKSTRPTIVGAPCGLFNLYKVPFGMEVRLAHAVICGVGKKPL